MRNKTCNFRVLSYSYSAWGAFPYEQKQWSKSLIHGVYGWEGQPHISLKIRLDLQLHTDTSHKFSMDLVTTTKSMATSAQEEENESVEEKPEEEGGALGQ